MVSIDVKQFGVNSSVSVSKSHYGEYTSFLSLPFNNRTENKLCEVLEIHVTDRFWKVEDTDPQTDFGKFLDALKNENDGC